jgi:NitT/TauT family transport system substrate-binding protein
LLFALSLVACSPVQEPVRIGILVWPPYELAYLARNRQLYPDHYVKLVDYQTPAEMVRAYRYGLLDGIFVTAQFILDRRMLPETTRIVYVIDTSLGGDSLVAQPGVRRLDDLKGRRIGIEAGPLGGYMLQRLIDLTGLAQNDIELVYLDTPDQAAAFQQGQIDAVITYEPTRSVLLKEGANELFSSRQIPNEICDVLLVSTDVLAAKEQELRAFVSGLSMARDLIARADEVLLLPLAQRQGLSVAEFNSALAGVELLGMAENLQLLGGAKPRLVGHLETQVETMLAARLIGDPISPAGIVDARLLHDAGNN